MNNTERGIQEKTESFRLISGRGSQGRDSRRKQDEGDQGENRKFSLRGGSRRKQKVLA